MPCLAIFVDWKFAHSRQNHTLGIESFITNKVRPAIIPLLPNYFQNRKEQNRMKHNGVISEISHQPGSEAQGASLENQEFINQTNENVQRVPTEKIFKYLNDLTTLDIINLLIVRLLGYISNSNLPFDVPGYSYLLYLLY